MIRRIWPCVLAILMLTACSQQPVLPEDMSEPARFDASDLVAAKPKNVRAAIRSSSEVAFSKATLKIDVLNDSGSIIVSELRLQPVSKAEAHFADLAAQEGATWTLFQLDDEDIPRMIIVQHQLNSLELDATQRKSHKLILSVNAQHDNMPDHIQNLPLRIDLSLDPDAGFFTLFDAIVPMQKG